MDISPWDNWDRTTLLIAQFADLFDPDPDTDECDVHRALSTHFDPADLTDLTWFQQTCKYIEEEIGDFWLPDEFHSNNMFEKLSSIWQFLFLFGAPALLDLKSKQEGNDAVDIMYEIQHSVAHFYLSHQDYTTVAPPEGLEKLSFCQATTRMKLFYARAEAWLMLPKHRLRINLARLGVIRLLELHPKLASEPCNKPLSCVSAIYPFSFLLWCGFPSEIIEKLHSSLSPAITEESKADSSTRMMRAAHEYRVLSPLSTFQLLHKLQPQVFLPDKLNRATLLEFLHHREYDSSVIEYAMQFVPKTVRHFSIRSIRPHEHRSLVVPEIGEQTKVLPRLLPQLSSLTCSPPRMTCDGLVEVMTHLGNPEINKNLESLFLSIPMDLIASSIEAQAALQIIFEKKGTALNRVIIDGAKKCQDGREYDFWDPTYEPHEPWVAGCDLALQSVGRGLQSGRSTSYLEELTIHGGLLSLDRSVGITSLLSNEVFFVDIQRSASILNGLHEDHLTATTNELRHYSFSCPWRISRSSNGCTLQRLNLYGMEMETECWTNIMQSLARLEHLKHLMIELPEPHLVIPTLESASKMKNLTHLSLIQSFDYDNILAGVFFDITSAIVALLDKKRLEFLKVQGSHRNRGCGYQIQMDPFCKALARNHCLRHLTLKRVAIKEHDGSLDGGSATELLLSALRKQNNTSLCHLEVVDNESCHFTSIEPGTVSRHDKHTFASWNTPWKLKHVESYHNARKVSYLVSLNKFGRGKVQDKQTNNRDLIGLLRKVHSSFGVKTSQDPFYDELLGLAEESNVGSLNYLDKLYSKLRNPKSLDGKKSTIWVDEEKKKNKNWWYYSLERDLDYLSILYGLLLESPSLWSSTSVPLSPRKVKLQRSVLPRAKRSKTE